MALDVSSSARRPAVSRTHSSADAGWFFTHCKENTIFFMSVFNQRSVINMWLLAPLPAVAVSVVSFFLCPVCPWLWQPAAGFFHVTQRCVQSWGRYSTSLLGGTDPQHERLGPSLKCCANFSLWLHWHWPRNTRFSVVFCPTVLRVCVNAKVRKKERMCNQVRFQPWRTR